MLLMSHSYSACWTVDNYTLTIIRSELFTIQSESVIRLRICCTFYQELIFIRRTIINSNLLIMSNNREKIVMRWAEYKQLY